MRVTTADFIKHYGRLADRALAEPLTITKNGHDRLVVLSADPRTVPPEQIADLDVRATFLAGRQVHQQ